jgi:hypothetical protein
MKEKLIFIAKFSFFLIIFTLPFISITQVLGLDTFLDSFENPDDYLILEKPGYIYGSKLEKNNFIIIQKSSHPYFDIQENDYIIYFSNNDYLNCNKVSSFEEIGRKKFYCIYDEKNTNQIYEKQVIGKVVNFIEDNIWNYATIKLWETSIKNLNINDLISD